MQYATRIEWWRGLPAPLSLLHHACHYMSFHLSSWSIFPQNPHDLNFQLGLGLCRSLQILH